MKKVVSTLGYDGIVTNPNLEDLQKSFLGQDYNSGACRGELEFWEDDSSKAYMIVAPDIDDEYGIHLKYFERGDDGSDRVWLSLHDPTRLHEVTQSDHEWYTSVGLFLPPERAWVGVKEFCLTGRRSEEITWIRPEDVPPDGNY